MAGLINKFNIGLGCVYTRSKQPTELPNSIRKGSHFMKKKYWISLPTHKQNQFEWLEYLDFQTIVLALVHSPVSQLLSAEAHL